MAAAAGGAGKEKEPPNEVHQNAIFRETVAKEQRHQKLFTKFTFNPYNDCKFSTAQFHIVIYNYIQIACLLKSQIQK